MFSRASRRERGFTLLEMTIAMSFVGLLAAGITLAISTCLNVWQRSVEAAELNQEARAVFELLSRDIGGAYLGLERTAGYLVGSEAPGGMPPVDSLVVCTESSGISRAMLVPAGLRGKWAQEAHPPVSDYAEVSYEWRPAAGKEPEGLYRTTRLVPRWGEGEETYHEAGSGGMAAELISDGVVSLGFGYFDGTQWVDSWETASQDQGLPWAVSVELVLRDAREIDHVYETLVPVWAR